jgi:hypothetical protein
MKIKKLGIRGATFWIVICGAVDFSLGHELKFRTFAPMHHLDKMVFKKSGDPLVDWNSSRTWTSHDGKTIEGKIVRAGAASVTVLVSSRRKTTIKLIRLSKEDRQFVKEWGELSAYFNLGYEPPRKLSSTVEAGMRDGVFAKSGKKHETRNFRFESDVELSADVVKDFSRLFEATYLAVQSLPLGLAPAAPKDGKYLVRLFGQRSDYHAAGGSPNAGGAYVLKDKVIIVPLVSLGLTSSKKGYQKTANYDPATLIHETTHAITHQWLNVVPIWFNEGLAEWVAAIPYEDGTIDFSKVKVGIRHRVKERYEGAGNRLPFILPSELVKVDDWVFMGKPSMEQTIALDPVEPFEFAARSDKSRAPSESSGDDAQPTLIAEGDIPLGPITTGNFDPIVSSRYGSSMLLVNHLLSSGQADALRKYLFSFLHYKWDRTRYLDRHRTAYIDHRSALQKQITAHSADVARYNREVALFNKALKSNKEAGNRSAPKAPEEPKTPTTLPVPEIIAKPRSAEELSLRAFRVRAASSTISLPPKLVVP